jgi:hypothetical protein
LRAAKPVMEIVIAYPFAPRVYPQVYLPFV